MKTIKFFSVLIVAALAVGIVSCKDDKEDPLPAIGGYNSADEVGKADLVAYWPLNGTGTESLSATNPATTKNVNWTTGVKGQAASFNVGFLKYPSIASLLTINGSVTISCWAKLSNTKLVADGVSTISPIFTLTGGTNAGIGNVSLFGNTHGLTTNDSIQLKAEYHFKMPDGISSFNGDCVNLIKQESWMDATHTWNANKIGGKWAHIVWIWDSATANTRIYVNGVKVSNSAWESRNNNIAMPFALFTPSYPVIGATWSVAEGTNADTWNAALKGEVDEIRVFKKALVLADIGALYELEKAAR